MPDPLVITYSNVLATLAKHRDDELGIIESRKTLRDSAITLLATAELSDQLIDSALGSCEIELLDELERLRPGIIKEWFEAGNPGNSPGGWFQANPRINSCAGIAQYASPQYISRLQDLSGGSAMSPYHVITGMVLQDHADGFAMALEGRPGHAPFDDGFPRDLKLIAECGPNVAPDMARRILAAKNVDGSAIRMIAEGKLDSRSIKVLSVLALAGIDLTTLASTSRFTPPKGFEEIIAKTSSNHGQMDLIGQDSLIAALGRPQTGRFFGLEGEAIS